MKDAEDIVDEFLRERGLTTRRFTKEEKRHGKTPDRRVFADGEFAFFCEVKDLIDADPLEDHFQEVRPGFWVAVQGKIGDVSRQNRFAKRIHEAVKQFDAVNPALEFPNVLALVNRDGLCSIVELRDLLVGGEMINGYRVSFSPPHAHKQIEVDRGRVHAFIWINLMDKQLPYRMFYWDRPCPHTTQLKKWLKMKEAGRPTSR